jgi:hypothetical protein
VHVSNVGWRWVATRLISSSMLVGFGFERMLRLLQTTVDIRSVSVDMYVIRLVKGRNGNVPNGRVSVWRVFTSIVPTP